MKSRVPLPSSPAALLRPLRLKQSFSGSLSSPSAYSSSSSFAETRLLLRNKNTSSKCVKRKLSTKIEKSRYSTNQKLAAIKVEMISPPPKHVVRLDCLILSASVWLPASFWLDWMLLLNHDWNSLNRPQRSAKPKDLKERMKVARIRTSFPNLM